MKTARAGALVLFLVGCANDNYTLTIALGSGDTAVASNQIAALVIKAVPERSDGSGEDFLCARISSATGTLGGARAPVSTDGGSTEGACQPPSCIDVRLSRETIPTAIVIYRAGAPGEDVLIGQLMVVGLCQSDTDTTIAATASLTLTVGALDAGIDVRD